MARMEEGLRKGERVLTTGVKGEGTRRSGGSEEETS